MRARATAVAAALLALAALVAAARSQRAHAEVAALGSSGDVQVANSKNGTAILGGVLAPGGAVTGTVTIANIGSAAGDFTLSLSHVIDTPGAGGGRLSRQLELAVDDLTPAAGPAPVYRGGLGSPSPAPRWRSGSAGPRGAPRVPPRPPRPCGSGSRGGSGCSGGAGWSYAMAA